jgi:hypothetical protein
MEPEDYPSIYVWVFQVFPFAQVSLSIPCLNLINNNNNTQ